MNIFPAIDLFDKKAVRLYKGEYDKMTVYSDNPIEIIRDFESAGAKFAHVVDLEGAKSGATDNFETIKSLVKVSSLFIEVGGGIRSIEVIDKYVDVGVKRVILGTAALLDRKFLIDAVKKYGDKIAVGVDIKDGFVAIKGWTEKSSVLAFDFLKEIENEGVTTVICTDISRDGAMKGTNHQLYEKMAKELKLNVIASGGVSSIEDVIRLNKLGIYGAIIGKAYYVKSIDLAQALKVAR